MANIRCEEIAADQLAALLGDQAWALLKGEAAAGVVSDFGQRASTLLHSCLTGTSADTAAAVPKGTSHHCVTESSEVREASSPLLAWAMLTSMWSPAC